MALPRWVFLLLLTPLLAAKEEEEPDPNISGEAEEAGKCKAPSNWDSKLRLTPYHSSYALNDLVQLSCAGEYTPSVSRIRCISNGTHTLWNTTATCKEKCQQPQWDSRLHFTPQKSFYRINEEVMLSCSMEDPVPLAVIRCAKGASPDSKYDWEMDSQGTWHGVAENLTCTTAPPETCQRPQWDARLRLKPDQDSYQKNEEVMLSCRKGFQPPFTRVKCVGKNMSSSNGKPEYREVWLGKGSKGQWNQAQDRVECIETCQRPQWDRSLQLAPNQNNYKKNEEVMLSCPEGFQPSFTHVKCSREAQSISHGKSEVWFGKDRGGQWNRIQYKVECIETCQRPQWDTRLQLRPDQDNYQKYEEVMLSCPEGLQPSFTHVKCTRKFLILSQGEPEYREVWFGKDSRGQWNQAQNRVQCIAPPESCQRPQWDSRLRLAPDWDYYKKNKEVTLSCPEGFQPSFTKIICGREVQPNSNGKPEYREVWLGKNSRGQWNRIQNKVECMEVLHVDPGTLEVSSTSIKVKWSCLVPEACSHMRAMCRLAGPSSPPCEAEEVAGEEVLHGQEGTFSCSALQPFTEYSVTISRQPLTILYRGVFRTKEMVPDKPEQLRLDPSTGNLTWEPLPSCKGEIIGYQLNITARSAQDRGLLELERLRLSGSVTAHPLPAHGPGSSYVVTVRGLTAAGAGAAALWHFQTNRSDFPQPPAMSCRSARDISPSQGTAVLPLHPIARHHELPTKHQLLVAALHNATTVEGVCSGEPQPFNASQQPGAYVAAVLNLSSPMDFVLGDGTRGQGYHNAALRPACNYTALLRLVRRSQQAEKFTCICYSFSVGQEPVPLLSRMPIATAVALVVGLLALGILLLFVIFRRKFHSSKTSENSSTIPLRRYQGGVSKMNTHIPVEALLEALKRFKRAEIEAEQTEDESVDTHGAGRLGEYQQLSSSLLHPCDAGKELCNQSKNRYKSIIPYDHCRVVLQPSDTGNGYINASYVDSYRSPHFFIAAQGPLPGTVLDFWQMVWQEKTSVIVMLTGLVEQNKTKCEQYWPEQEQVYGDFTVTLNNTRTTTGLVTRIFSLQKAGCALPRVVEQFHYLLWPDHGVPRNSAQLLCLVDVVNKRASEAPAGPVVVHCRYWAGSCWVLGKRVRAALTAVVSILSAGIGRTGTFIALDFLLKMGKAEGKVDVFHCVQRLREQRISMVQTKEQYTFLYEVVLEGLLCGSTGVPVESIASHVRCLREAEASRHNHVLEKEFKALQKFSELFQLLPCREAEKPSNQPKNRKPGILPADSCRPILMSSLNADGSPGYINAVFVNTYTEEDRLIITQMPFPTTVMDFWALVWDYTCTAVVVLNQLQELDEEPSTSLWAPSRRPLRTPQRRGVPSLTAREHPSGFPYPCPVLLFWLQHHGLVPRKWQEEHTRAHCGLWTKGWCVHTHVKVELCHTYR
ncbi:receptor-type tyrosine-protein phosphatase T-like isoform 3-T3 [Amazona ochrocephala]